MKSEVTIEDDSTADAALETMSPERRLGLGMRRRGEEEDASCFLGRRKVLCDDLALYVDVVKDEDGANANVMDDIVAKTIDDAVKNCIVLVVCRYAILI